MIAPRLNPDWYRVKYGLAALYANWATDERKSATAEERAQHRRKGHTEARELAEKTLETLVKPPKAQAGLAKLLRETILPTTLVLYAGTSGQAAGPHRHPAAGPKNETELLHKLEGGHLSATAALAYVDSGDPSPRVRYNLACAYAQQEDLEEARAQLRTALLGSPGKDRVRLSQRALKDPSLRPLLKANGGLKAEVRKWAKTAPARREKKEKAKAAKEKAAPKKAAPKRSKRTVKPRKTPKPGRTAKKTPQRMKPTRRRRKI